LDPFSAARANIDQNRVDVVFIGENGRAPNAIENDPTAWSKAASINLKHNRREGALVDGSMLPSTSGSGAT
jgi:hypothetical protein